MMSDLQCRTEANERAKIFCEKCIAAGLGKNSVKQKQPAAPAFRPTLQPRRPAAQPDNGSRLKLGIILGASAAALALIAGMLLKPAPPAVLPLSPPDAAPIAAPKPAAGLAPATVNATQQPMPAPAAVPGPLPAESDVDQIRNQRAAKLLADASRQYKERPDTLDTYAETLLVVSSTYKSTPSGPEAAKVLEELKPLIAKLEIRQKANNLLRNPGFESGQLDPWMAWGKASISPNPTDARTGKFCIRVDPGDNGFGQIVNGLTPNTTYELTGWLNVHGAGNVPFWIAMGVKDFGEADKFVATSSGVYTKLLVTFTTARDKSSAVVYCWKTHGDWGYCDDFTLTSAPPEVVATARMQKPLWRYATERPAGDWMKPEFDAGAWKEGPAGFGTIGTPASVVNTEWKSDDIWLRREFEIPDAAANADGKDDLRLVMHHDDDAEVYINGVLAVKESGYLADYKEFDIGTEAKESIKAGKNMLAVHCHQVKGGQYIDVGIVKLSTAK